MDTRYFYRDKKVLPRFEDAANGERHQQVPDDWFIIIADIAGSTQAIEAGRYKDVNTVGAATIMAVINVDRSIEIPFVFGGDGATLAIPACMETGVREALLGAKEMAKAAFNLELRAGLVPVRDVYTQGLFLGVGKYQQSKTITQSSFSGFGWGWAEETLKHPETRKLYEVTQDKNLKANADFTGFECRWQPVKARKDFKLAVIVQSTSKNSADHAAIYDSVLQRVSQIYGEVIEYHPLNRSSMELSLHPKRLMGEALVHCGQFGFLKTILRVIKLMSTSLLGHIAFKYDLKILNVRWGHYKQEVVDNADFRKFDGSLKMVMDSSASEEQQLRTYLEGLHKDKKIVYGSHRSQFAIMTCMVFTAGQDHAHFVDGSDGGYALAAKELKQQLLEYKANQKPTLGFAG